MNEKIKKRIMQFIDGYELACSHKYCDESCSKKWYEEKARKDIFEELYGYYLQGAKDMWEAVGLNGDRYVYEVTKKQAQQFIDSLEVTNDNKENDISNS